MRASECAVIGSVLRDPSLLADTRVRNLQPGDFVEDDTRPLWSAILRLLASGEHIDAATVSETTEGRRLAANCWRMVEDAYSTANAAVYAERIREAGRIRRERAAALALAETLRQGDTAAADRLRSELQALGSRAPEAGTRTRVGLLAAERLTLRPVRWLWPGWLPAGKLTLLAGSPGTGKTTAALALAATLTVAGRWPDGTRCMESGRALIWSGEDDAGDTLVPRLLAAGADLSHCAIVGDVAEADGSGRPFDPAKDVPALLDAVLRLPEPPRLLIVDPIVSAVAGDSHKNAETRRGLAPLVDLAQRTGCALLGITHLSKGTAGRDPLERLTGSLAFGALTRVAWATAIVRDPEPGAPRRLLARIKSNLGPDGGAIGYDLEPATVGEDIETSRVLWGDILDGDARALLATAEAPPQCEDDERTERDECADWLREVLAGGPLPARQVEALARNAGLPWRSVQRAKGRAGVTARRSGFGRGGAWVWALAAIDATQPAIDADTPEAGINGTYGSYGTYDRQEPCEEGEL